MKVVVLNTLILFTKENNEQNEYATFTVKKFSLGLGYIQEPINKGTFL